MILTCHWFVDGWFFFFIVRVTNSLWMIIFNSQVHRHSDSWSSQICLFILCILSSLNCSWACSNILKIRPFTTFTAWWWFGWCKACAFFGWVFFIISQFKTVYGWGALDRLGQGRRKLSLFSSICYWWAWNCWNDKIWLPLLYQNLLYLFLN